MMVIEIVIKEAAPGFNLMSHSRSRLPLDPVSWREVLIRAAGTNGRGEKKCSGGERQRKKEQVIDSSVALVCCSATRLPLSVHI